ncbi:ribosomal protein L49/IMG2 [Ophiocordyceps camponoti-floridani]|uniref:Large ribosomal subunit protein mL49 n=1 Tax=Ophiocordyceps camponoti-floridani TaxID=2030778 RepID=A0A8H4VCS6_9HYPO|nr:ribosomal protein L49/IMG2 [Ophiocordyceps camponoti-floridani]
MSRLLLPRLFRVFVSNTPSPAVTAGSALPLTAVEQNPEAPAAAPAAAQTETSASAPVEATIEAPAEALSSNTPVQPTAQAVADTGLPYAIRRTPSCQLPIYSATGRKFTRIKNVTGDLVRFRDDIIKDLNISPGYVWISPTTKHLCIKGYLTPLLKGYLSKKGF